MIDILQYLISLSGVYSCGGGGEFEFKHVKCNTFVVRQAKLGVYHQKHQSSIIIN